MISTRRDQQQRARGVGHARDERAILPDVDAASDDANRQLHRERARDKPRCSGVLRSTERTFSQAVFGR